MFDPGVPLAGKRLHTCMWLCMQALAEGGLDNQLNVNSLGQGHHIAYNLSQTEREWFAQ